VAGAGDLSAGRFISLIFGRSGGGGFGSVGGGVPCVASDMSGGGGVTGGASGESSSGMFGLAGGGVSSKCGDARLGHRQLATRPGTRSLNCPARPVVTGMSDLEAGEHRPGAPGSPQRRGNMRLLVEWFGKKPGHGARRPRKLRGHRGRALCDVNRDIGTDRANEAWFRQQAGSMVGWLIIKLRINSSRLAVIRLLARDLFQGIGHALVSFNKSRNHRDNENGDGNERDRVDKNKKTSDC